MITIHNVFASLLVAATGLTSEALAQETSRTETVYFAAGASGASLSGRIEGRDFVVYEIGAEAGQRMQVTLTSDNLATYFNVYEPGSAPGGEALAVGDLTGPLMPDINRFDGILPSSGVYSVSVYLYRSAARRGETSDYALDISITGDTGETVKGDFADGLQGGPDYWRVRTNSVLHLRERPSSGARVVIDLRDGAELRNLGCRMAEGRRWCRVATLADPGDEGWVAGDFLVEGSGDTARQRSEADATVPGTDFHATGVVECYDAPGGETQMCDFGVMRDGNGGGIVLVKLPDGRSRAIYYDDGVPTGFDRSEADGDISFEAKQVEDGFMVFIGPASFVIPEAVVQGG